MLAFALLALQLITGIKNINTTMLLAATLASTVAFSAQATTSNLVINGSFGLPRV